MRCVGLLLLGCSVRQAVEDLLRREAVEAWRLGRCLDGRVQLAVQEADHRSDAADVAESVAETDSEKAARCTLLVDQLQAEQGIVSAHPHVLVRQTQVEEAALLVTASKLQVLGPRQAAGRDAGSREWDAGVVQHDLPFLLCAAPVGLPQAAGGRRESVQHARDGLGPLAHIAANVVDQQRNVHGLGPHKTAVAKPQWDGLLVKLRGRLGADH
mmetsp:Transcript_95869/g.254666  ORF Transcript_95869/g.254666 Transcript_95869/m.254666 type:complete len:213 (-) Transcript_95869:516-1154(-)